jgi:hypothetical protein
MAAAYPIATATFTNKENIVDIIDKSHVNNVQDEIVAIQATVGTQPNLSTSPSPTGIFTSTATSFSTVSARLANIETGIVADTHSQYIRKNGDTANVIQPVVASTKGLVVRGAASQSANLQEWQTSGGAVVTSITAGGSIVTTAPTDSAYVRNIYVSTSSPTGGNDGDVWLKYS